MRKVTQIHEAQPELLIGPFTNYAVQIEGRKIPGLSGMTDGEDHTLLIVDERFSVSIPNAIARDIAWLLANALAIGQGYPSFQAETKDRPFAPLVFGMDMGKDSK